MVLLREMTKRNHLIIALATWKVNARLIQGQMFDPCRRAAATILDTRFIMVLDFDRRNKHGVSFTWAFLAPGST